MKYNIYNGLRKLYGTEAVKYYFIPNQFVSGIYFEPLMTLISLSAQLGRLY